MVKDYLDKVNIKELKRDLAECWVDGNNKIKLKKLKGDIMKDSNKDYNKLREIEYELQNRLNKLKIVNEKYELINIELIKILKELKLDDIIISKMPTGAVINRIYIKNNKFYYLNDVEEEIELEPGVYLNKLFDYLERERKEVREKIKRIFHVLEEE